MNWDGMSKEGRERAWDAAMAANPETEFYSTYAHNMAKFDWDELYDELLDETIGGPIADEEGAEACLKQLEDFLGRS